MQELTPTQRDLLLHLLSRPFPGRDELLAQLDHTFVVGTDPAGPTFAMEVTGGPRAFAAVHLPVEAVGPDEDGHPVHVLLHIVDGYLGEFEVYRKDFGRVQRMPSPALLELTVYPIEGWANSRHGGNGLARVFANAGMTRCRSRCTNER